MSDADRESMGRCALAALAIIAAVALTSCVDRDQERRDEARACIARCADLGCGAWIEARCPACSDGCVCTCDYEGSE